MWVLESACPLDVGLVGPHVTKGYNGRIVVVRSVPAPACDLNAPWRTRHTSRSRWSAGGAGGHAMTCRDDTRHKWKIEAGGHPDHAYLNTTGRIPCPLPHFIPRPSFPTHSSHSSPHLNTNTTSHPFLTHPTTTSPSQPSSTLCSVSRCHPVVQAKFIQDEASMTYIFTYIFHFYHFLQHILRDLSRFPVARFEASCINYDGQGNVGVTCLTSPHPRYTQGSLTRLPDSW